MRLSDLSITYIEATESFRVPAEYFDDNHDIKPIVVQAILECEDWPEDA